MPFSESIKLQAKQRANFRCVVCKQFWVEVHHIQPQEEAGPDTLDNAATLCGSCHNQYGANPMLRKQLREMRDWWWQQCTAERAVPHAVGLAQQMDQLREELTLGLKRQDVVLTEVKALLTHQLQAAQQQIASSSTLGAVLSVTSSLSTGLSEGPISGRPISGGPISG